MRLANDGDQTFGLMAWAGSPRVQIGRIIVEKHGTDLYECDIAVGRYPATDVPAIIIASTGELPDVQVYRYFDALDWPGADKLINILTGLARINFDDILLLGFQEINEHRKS